MNKKTEKEKDKSKEPRGKVLEMPGRKFGSANRIDPTKVQRPEKGHGSDGGGEGGTAGNWGGGATKNTANKR